MFPLASLPAVEICSDGRILKDIAIALPYDHPEKILHTMVAWGRYAGLMDYNASARTVFVLKEGAAKEG